LNAGEYELTITDSNGNSTNKALEIPPFEETVLTEIICFGEELEGYTESGVYMDMFTSSKNCDSIRILELTVSPIIETTIEASKCEGNNQEVFTKSLIDTLISVYGCDSIVRTNLTIYPRIILTEIDTSICAGESIEGYNKKGSYIDFFESVAGCDSIRLLDLSILDQENFLCQTSNDFTISPNPTSKLVKISKSNDFTISPNPTNGLIKITFDNFDFLGHKMRLFNTNGELFIETSLNSYSQIINVEGLPGGVYLLVIDSVDVRYIEKLVKL